MPCCFEYYDLDTRRILKYFEQWFEHWICILNIAILTFYLWEHSVGDLAWQQILMPHFVSIVWSVMIFFGPGG